MRGGYGAARGDFGGAGFGGAGGGSSAGRQLYVANVCSLPTIVALITRQVLTAA